MIVTASGHTEQLMNMGWKTIESTALAYMKTRVIGRFGKNAENVVLM